jgi:hypothetical protein
VLAVAGVMLLVLPGRANLKMDEIMALVPGDQTVAAIMAPGTLPALAEIAEKLREAASKNPEWWREYAQQTPPGEPLPYHPKMEIDEEEYAEYVTLAGGPQVIQFGKLLLEVTSPQKGVFRISAGDTVPERMRAARSSPDRGRVCSGSTTDSTSSIRRASASSSPSAGSMTQAGGSSTTEYCSGEPTTRQGK